MKKYLPLIEAINAVCWFSFDFSWMQEWTISAQAFSLLAMITGIFIFIVSWSWSSGALLNWIIMNSLWMNEINAWATVFGCAGFIMIIISIIKDRNLKDFIRFKIKRNDTENN